MTDTRNIAVTVNGARHGPMSVANMALAAPARCWSTDRRCVVA